MNARLERLGIVQRPIRSGRLRAAPGVSNQPE